MPGSTTVELRIKKHPQNLEMNEEKTNKAAAYAMPYQKEKGVISTAGKEKNGPIFHPPFPAFSEKKSKHTS